MTLKKRRVTIFVSSLSVAILLISVFALKINLQASDKTSRANKVVSEQIPSKYEQKSSSWADKIKSYEAWGDKFDSIEKAQTKLKFKFALPSDTKNRQFQAAYVEKNPDENLRSVKIVFGNDLVLSAYPDPSSDSEQQAHFTQVIGQSAGKSASITVNGKSGCGSEPNTVKDIFGNEILNPGSIAWWDNNVTYSLTGQNLSVTELVDIANSSKLP